MEELELTYLVKQIPEGLSGCPSKQIIDRYIPEKSHHPSLRLRKSGEKIELTKKEPIKENDVSHQLEQTIRIIDVEFEALSKIPAKAVSKTRYYYPYQGKTVEIDVFEEALRGLVMADVEFETLREKDAFPMPDFCLAEVTQEKGLAGGMLAGKGMEDIREVLNRFGYQEIKSLK